MRPRCSRTWTGAKLASGRRAKIVGGNDREYVLSSKESSVMVSTSVETTDKVTLRYRTHYVVEPVEGSI